MKKIVTILLLSALLTATAACSTPAPVASSSAPASSAVQAETQNATDAVDAEMPVEGAPEQDFAEYGGKFVSIEKGADGKTGQLMMEDDQGEAFIFNFDEKTIFGADPESLAAGTRLHIRHSMAVTFSLPPQSYAFEVQPASGQSEQGGAQAATEKLYVADAVLYRGVLDDFAVDPNGNTVWVLRQAAGTDYGHAHIQVVLDENTKYSFDTKNIGNGAYLEVFYGGKPDANKTVTAIAVNDAGPLDLVNFNGVVKEIATDGKSGTILLDAIEEGGMGFQFNISEETQFYIDAAAIKVGDKLNVYHSPMATRSIPPQSNALEINVMAE